MCSRAAAYLPDDPLRFRAPYRAQIRAGPASLVGNEAGQFSEQGRKDGLESTGCSGIAELDTLRQDGGGPRFDLAIWFYPPEIESASDGPVFERLTKLTDNLVLIPGAGADVAKRRPRLVVQLASLRFFPNYECDVVEIEPGAVRLTRKTADSIDTLLPAVETGFARMNAQFRRMRRTLRTRMSELEAADRHIARLEEKVLKLKQAKRDLKQLRVEKQALRKSPERKIGQVILAPYRLPQKLIREVRKRLGGPVAPKNPALTPNEYQKWFERHRVTPAEAAALRTEARTFTSQPLVSIITPVFNTPVPWLEEAVASVEQQAYETGSCSWSTTPPPIPRRSRPAEGRAARSADSGLPPGKKKRNLSRLQRRNRSGARNLDESSRP